MIVLTVAFALCGASTVFAAGDEKNGHAYFTKAELPDMTKILPPFPPFESARFVADQSQHLWGKLMRQDEARAAQAQRDAVYSMQTIIDEFGPLFGVDITKEDTPEIYSILQDVCASCDSIYSGAKAVFGRQRPYAYYNEGTLVPEKEEKHRKEGSYPSGHTVLGWTSALLLADINQSAEAMERLLARGYDFGQSRVIAGYHWQSDVDAGRMAGTVIMSASSSSWPKPVPSSGRKLARQLPYARPPSLSIPPPVPIALTARRPTMPPRVSSSRTDKRW